MKSIIIAIFSLSLISCKTLSNQTRSEYAAKIIEDQKESLKELAELRLSGKITDDQFKSELEDVAETVKNQNLAIIKPKK